MSLRMATLLSSQEHEAFSKTRGFEGFRVQGSGFRRSWAVTVVQCPPSRQILKGLMPKLVGTLGGGGRTYIYR